MAVSAVVALASTAAVSASAIIAGTMTLSAFATTFAVNFALGAALRALTPKPSIGGIGGSNRGYQTTAIGTALDHQIIYGKVRVGGARIYDEATGENNKSYIVLLLSLGMRYSPLMKSTLTTRL